VSPRDRQDAILGWLRSRGSATVEEVAERFDVSLRTAHRDLAALRELGIPIEGEPGRGGGVRLDPLRALPPVRLELDEVVGLVLAVSLARRSGALPFGPAAGTAIGKLLATLPPARARELRRALDRVLVGPPASPAVTASAGEVREAVVRAFEEAFTAGRALAFGYVDRRGVATERRAEPHGLLLQVPVWYLLAWDLDRRAPRMFRLDRIGDHALLSQGFEPRPLEVFRSLLDEIPAERVDDR
jgi:predicted DNA-binding transcriptional regulator YafY